MTKRMLLGVAFALAIAATGCSKKPDAGAQAAGAEEKEPFGRMSVDELDAKMKEAKEGKLALFVYDNNEKERWQVDHIPGAKWMDHQHVEAKDLPADKNATLVFYCANEH